MSETYFKLLRKDILKLLLKFFYEKKDIEIIISVLGDNIRKLITKVKDLECKDLHLFPNLEILKITVNNEGDIDEVNKLTKLNDLEVIYACHYKLISKIIRKIHYLKIRYHKGPILLNIIGEVAHLYNFTIWAVKLFNIGIRELHLYNDTFMDFGGFGKDLQEVNNISFEKIYLDNYNGNKDPEEKILNAINEMLLFRNRIRTDKIEFIGKIGISSIEKLNKILASNNDIYTCSEFKFPLMYKYAENIAKRLPNVTKLYVLYDFYSMRHNKIGNKELIKYNLIDGKIIYRA